MLLHFSGVQTWLIKQFTEKLSSRLNTEVSINKVAFSFFDKLHLEGVQINDQENDTLLYVDELIATIDYVNINKKEVGLESILLSGCQINSKLDVNRESNFSFILNSFRKKDAKNPFLWSISCQNFELNNVFIKHHNENDKNRQEIKLQDIQFEAQQFVLNPDSLYFEISGLKVSQDDDFKINDMSACFSEKDKVLQIANFNIATDKSFIKDLNLTIDQSHLTAGEKITQANIDLSLGTTQISMADLAHFFPVIQHPGGYLKLSGNISGRLDSIHGKNIHVQRGKETSINCDFYAYGLPNFKQSEYSLILRKSSLELDDLNEIMQSKFVSQNDFLNRILHGVGIIKYDGSFKGSAKDFLAKGVFETNYGRLEGNLSFSPSTNSNIKAKGKLIADNFQLGELLQNKRLGSTNFKGQVNGILSNKNKFIQAQVEGRLDSLTFNNYCYQNINLNGLIKPKLFEGKIAVNDKNIKLKFDGLANANPKNPNFIFNLKLDDANLKELNFMSRYTRAEMALNMNANFSGEDFAHLFGEVNLPSGYFITEYDTLHIDSISVQSSVDSTKKLRLKSNYADYQMNGKYNYSELYKTFRNILHYYLPHIAGYHEEEKTNNDFDFELRIKNLQPILHTFLPSLVVDSGYVVGSINEHKKDVFINGQISSIITPTILLHNTELNVKTSNKIRLKLGINEAYVGRNENPFRIDLNSDLIDNTISNQLSWHSDVDNENFGTLVNQIDFHADSTIILANHRSNFRLNDILWQVSPSNIIFHHSKSISINNFMINNSFQSMYINGIASKQSNDSIQLKLTNIDLKNINPFLPQRHRFDGTMNGELNLYSLLSNMHIVGNFHIDDLMYNHEDLGNIKLESNWNKAKEAINAHLDIEQPQGNLQATGYFEPSADSLHIAANADKISLNFLSPLLSSIFKNIKGYASGHVVFHGKKSKILIDGDLVADQAQLALNALNVNYHFNDTVKFRQDSIIFDKIKIYDDENHSGAINGSLKHTNFNHMVYNLSMLSNDLMIINTTSADNEQFFGKAYGRGNIRITGIGTQVAITGSATTLANTDINFAPMSDEKAEVYNFLSFVNHNTADSTLNFNNLISSVQTKSQLDMKFNFTVTPDAKFKLIFNSKVGDVIQARGKGNLQVNIDQDFNIGMFGKFEATWGDYLFTLQNIFNKRFSIEQGSTIQWSGNPLAANLDIKAIYTLKAPLSDLITDNYSGYDFTQRVPVDCYIILKDQLSNPNISFDIKFPTVEDRIQDELKQYMSTEEDMNRQMLSLLVMGNFYTPEYLQGSYSGMGTSFMGTTTSELLSNQLSNWLSAISDNFDLGINYRPGNDITDDEVELALSTQLFNNRVTINGNISNNVNTTGSTNTNNNSAFVGDFDILVALSKNGKLQLKAYNHSNNNIIYETSPYKQGVGFSYQEDFNTWKEFWQKIKNIFRWKKNKKEINR